MTNVEALETRLLQLAQNIRQQGWYGGDESYIQKYISEQRALELPGALALDAQTASDNALAGSTLANPTQTEWPTPGPGAVRQTVFLRRGSGGGYSSVYGAYDINNLPEGVIALEDAGIFYYYFDPATQQYGATWNMYFVPPGAYPISEADYVTGSRRETLLIAKNVQARSAENMKASEAILQTVTQVMSHAPGVTMGVRALTPNAYLGKTLITKPDGSLVWEYPATWQTPPEWFTLERQIPLGYWAWLSYKTTGDNLAWASKIIANPTDFPLVAGVFQSVSSAGYPGVYPRLSFAKKLRDAILAGVPGGQAVAQEIVLPGGVNSVIETPAVVAPVLKTPQVNTYSTKVGFAGAGITSMANVESDPVVAPAFARPMVADEPAGAYIAGESVPVVALNPGIAPGNPIVTVPGGIRPSVAVEPASSGQTALPTIAGPENAVLPAPATESPLTAGFDLKSFKTLAPVVGILIVLGLIFGKGKGRVGV